jgi:type I restriction enzyme S subunit
MAGEWKTLPLQDCMAAIIDYRGKTPDKKTFGIPLVTAKVIKGGRIERPDEFIAEADFDAWMRRGMPESGDIVMTTEAPLGEIAQLDGKKVALAQRVITLRGKPDLLDNTFLKFLLQSHSVQEELQSRATGTTVLGIRQSEMRKVNLTLPPFPEQKAIAHVLGTLDDLIELNRETNEILEEMARALFKSWFVDFDPVRAKLEGRPPAGMDAATAALFPDHFQDSELGQIPKGWEVKSLDEIADFLNGLALQKFPANDGPTLPVIKIAQLRKGDVAGADRCNTNVPTEFVVQDGDVLFSWSGTLAVEIWCGGNGALNQHLFKVTSAEFPKWFYLNWTRQHLEWFQSVAADKAVTMGHIKRGHLTEAKVMIPSGEIIDAMTAIMDPLIEQVISNRIESRDLATLRDTLLPKLLSGEITVPVAEELIAAVK